MHNIYYIKSFLHTQGQRRTTYAQRQGVRPGGNGNGGGANIRGINRLGCAKAGAGG